MSSAAQSTKPKVSKWTPELAYAALQDVIGRCREAGIIAEGETVYIAAVNGKSRLVAKVDTLGAIAVTGTVVHGG